MSEVDRAAREAIEAIALRLNAQEVLMAAVVKKLGVTKEEAFAGLDLLELSEATRDHVPAIRQLILQTLHHHR